MAHGRGLRIYRRLLIGRAVFGESKLPRLKEEAPSEWSFSSLEEDEEVRRPVVRSGVFTLALERAY